MKQKIFTLCVYACFVIGTGVILGIPKITHKALIDASEAKKEIKKRCGPFRNALNQDLLVFEQEYSLRIYNEFNEFRKSFEKKDARIDEYFLYERRLNRLMASDTCKCTYGFHIPKAVNSRLDIASRILQEKFESNIFTIAEYATTREAYALKEIREPIHFDGISIVYWYFLIMWLIATCSIVLSYFFPRMNLIFDPRGRLLFLWNVFLYPVTLFRAVLFEGVIRRYGDKAHRILSEEDLVLLKKYTSILDVFALHRELENRGLRIKRSFLAALIGCFVAIIIDFSNSYTLSLKVDYGECMYELVYYSMQANAPPGDTLTVWPGYSFNIFSLIILREVIVRNFLYCMLQSQDYIKVLWQPPRMSVNIIFN